MPLVIDMRDIKRAQRALRTLSQPELRKTTSKSLTQAVRAVVIPEMRNVVSSSVRGSSPRRPSGMAPPKRGTSGPLAKSVRSKQYRRRGMRQGEMIAIGVGPRAWYKHWVIQGTQAHTLRGPRGTYRMDGAGGAVVPPRGLTRWHPGGRPNDIITQTERRIAPKVGTKIGTDLISQFGKQMARKP